MFLGFLLHGVLFFVRGFLVGDSCFAPFWCVFGLVLGRISHFVFFVVLLVVFLRKVFKVVYERVVVVLFCF